MTIERIDGCIGFCTGVIVGVIDGVLMLALEVLSLIHKRPPMKYGTWKIIHDTFSILFIGAYVWHAIDTWPSADMIN